jgi:hypothetical protein
MSRAIVIEAFWRITQWGIAARWPRRRPALATAQAAPARQPPPDQPAG